MKMRERGRLIIRSERAVELSSTLSIIGFASFFKYDIVYTCFGTFVLKIK